MAQLIVATAAAAVGFAIGGPQGAQIGFTLGSALAAPTQKSQGPRLSDLKVSGTEYGQTIPYCEGAVRTAGQIVWASERREIATTTEQGGKGGGAESTTYTYEVDLLYLLTDNEIIGVRRIWNNGKLVWTADAGATHDSLDASENSELWTRLTVYNGDVAQLPDPTYEASVTTAKAVAYRGRGSVFIESLQLGNSGQIPNLSFEVMCSGMAAGYSTKILDAPLTTDEVDIISPAATPTFSNPSHWSYDSTNGATVYSLPSTSTDLEYSGAKLLHVTHPSVDITVSLDATILTTDGSGTRNDNRFIIVSDLAGNTVAFSHRMVSDVIQLRTNVETTLSGTSVYEDAPSTPTAANYKIVFEADEAHVAFYVDDVFVRRAVFPRLDGPSAVVVLAVTAWGFGGVSSYYFENLKVYTNSSPLSTTVYSAPDVDLDDVVSRVCLRTGLTAGQIDVTGLASITKKVHSMPVSQVTPARNVLETLASSYYFGCVLSDKLYFRPRGGSSSATLPYAALGAGENQAQDNPLTLKLTSELEIPAQIATSYINIDADYNIATEYSDRLLSGQDSTQTSGIPLGFTAAEAKGIADTFIADAAAAMFSTSVSVLSQYARLEPTDIVTLTDADGSTYRTRILKKTEAPGLITFDVVADDATVLKDSGTTSSDYTNSTVVTAPADSTLVLMDIPILRDADDPLGLYAACYGSSTPYPGAQLFKSPDTTTWETRQTFTDAAGVGYTTSALTTWPGGNVFDEKSTVTVVMRSGTLSSYTRTQILNGTAPGYLIGSEIVYCKTATLTDTNTYTLSGFLRGRRGTDDYQSGHAYGENFVVLSTSGIRRESMETSELSAVRYFKAVTLGRRLSSATNKAITFAGVGKKPFSPCNLRATRLAAGTSDDADFDKVQLLLHGDGANNGVIFTDSSIHGYTPTVSGNTKTSTTQFKFGTASMYFDGSGDYLTYTGMPTASGDFVIDVWIRPDTVTPGAGRVLFDNRNTTTDTHGFALYHFGTGVNVYSGTANKISSGAVLAATTWAYVALRRVSGVIELRVNGSLAGTWTTSQSFDRGRVVIGRDDPGAAQYYTGYMDELRYKVGDGEASRDFTETLQAYSDTVQDSSTTVTWNRRTRLAKNFTTGLAPLGEASEAYTVRVYSDGTYTTALRTETVTTNEFVYPRADQIDDFGSFQSTLYIGVTQTSATVGEGYEHTRAI